VDERTNQPTMVDVTEKSVSQRVARAQSLVQLPFEIKSFMQGDELVLKKGPVFQTAIIAGTMAAKKTYEVIPFCHQIPIESCKITIDLNEDLLVTVICEVKTTAKTGVEMEALNGAMTAALTIYDMCKAISHQIVIQETKLISKTGGKRTVLDRPMYGVVLTGGKSERMKRDKAMISYKGRPHAQFIREILKGYCEEVYLSARGGQWKGTALEEFPTIQDSGEARGPIAGILSAFEKHPKANWFVVACDLVHFNHKAVETLLANYNPEAIVTAYQRSEEGFPEPLCALYTPEAKHLFATALENGVTCPVKVLRNANVHVVDQIAGVDLTNVNTIEDFADVKNENN
jgi:cyclic pyranopterin phosphate synthase